MSDLISPKDVDKLYWMYLYHTRSYLEKFRVHIPDGNGVGLQLHTPIKESDCI